MNEQSTTLLSRIGRWFRKDAVGGEHVEGNGDRQSLIGEPSSSHSDSTAIATRTNFLRPWAKRDADIAQLREGFHTLTDLMGTIRDNLERQNQRQDELLEALKTMPQVLGTIPESNRVQTETLQAIRVQIAGQSSQQERLGEILNKIGETTGSQKQVVDELRGRVEEIHKQDVSIADYLNNVGSSLKDVSKNSQTSAQVLETMRDNINARDGQIERVLHRQGVRFTTMLAVAIFLSIAALVAVGVIGFMLLNRPGGPLH